MSLFARKVRILNWKEKYFIPPTHTLVVTLRMTSPFCGTQSNSKCVLEALGVEYY